MKMVLKNELKHLLLAARKVFHENKNLINPSLISPALQLIPSGLRQIKKVKELIRKKPFRCLSDTLEDK